VFVMLLGRGQSVSTNGHVGDDINMILSPTRFLSFDLFHTGMCVAAVTAFDLDRSFMCRMLRLLAFHMCCRKRKV
jgi:hypothetical protein